MSIIIEIGREEPKFVCTGCGKCCYGGDGALLLWHEVDRYREAFPDVQLKPLGKGTRIEGLSFTIPHKEGTDGCIHLNENGKTCALHNSELKPRLCCGWPKSPDSQRQNECLGLWLI